VTVLGDSQDNAVIEGFFSDLIGRASSILSAAEPLLLDSLTLERRLYPPGEPVGFFKFIYSEAAGIQAEKLALKSCSIRLERFLHDSIRQLIGPM
jgi:hypothetical protein